MKKSIIIVLLFIGLILVSCDEKSPTEVPLDQVIREIRTINIQDNTNALLSREVGYVNNLGFTDNSTVFFTTVYSYGKPASGYTFAENIVRQPIDSPTKSTIFNAPSYINSLINRNALHFTFASGGDIYKVTTDGSSSFNLTNSTEYESAGVLNEYSNELFVGTKFSENNQLYKINLTTNEKFHLIENSINYIYPLFLCQDNTRLIYLESNNVVSPARGYLKTLEINNPQNQHTLVEVSTTSMLDISKSNNDILVFPSDGKIFMVDIPNNEIKVIALGNSADISTDGIRIIYSDGRNNLWLYSIVDENIQQLYYEEVNNIYFPRFSPDGQKAVFITSAAPLY